MKRKLAVFLALCMIFTQAIPAWAETIKEGNIGAAALETTASPSDAEKASPSDAEPATSSDALPGSLEDAKVENVMYLDENGEEQSADCIIIDRDLDSLSLQADTWYAIEGKHTVAKRIENNAPEANPAHLILTDGCRWTVPSGIHNCEGRELIIYAQSLEADDTGTLEIAFPRSFNFNSGIGADADEFNAENAGILTINGGRITVIGSYSSAIGTGVNGLDGGTVTINGGEIHLESHMSFAIGARDRLFVVINGGSVTAVGGTGYPDSEGQVTGTPHCGIGVAAILKKPEAVIEINGGIVKAIGGTGVTSVKRGGAGIGGQSKEPGITVCISGGSVYAQGGYGAAGIGGGISGQGTTQPLYANGVDVTISGGRVTAIGGEGAPGIGGASGCQNDGMLTLTPDTKADPRSELEILA